MFIKQIEMIDCIITHLDVLYSTLKVSEPSALESLRLTRAAAKAARQGITGEDIEFIDLYECYWDMLEHTSIG